MHRSIFECNSARPCDSRVAANDQHHPAAEVRQELENRSDRRLGWMRLLVGTIEQSASTPELYSATANRFNGNRLSIGQNVFARGAQHSTTAGSDKGEPMTAPRRHASQVYRDPLATERRETDGDSGLRNRRSRHSTKGCDWPVTKEPDQA